jgi:hypothetical protein
MYSTTYKSILAEPNGCPNSWGAPLQPVKVETYFTTLTIVLAEQTHGVESGASPTRSPRGSIMATSEGYGELLACYPETPSEP